MPRLPHDCAQSRRRIRKFFSLVPDRVTATKMGAEAAQIAADIRDHIQDIRKPDQVGCRSCHSYHSQLVQIHWGDDASHSAPVMANREPVAS